MTVQGLVAGVTTSEVLQFSGSGYKRTLNAFASIIGITTSGLADEGVIPTVSAALKGHDNSPVQVPYTLVSGYPATVDEASNGWPAQDAAGRFQVGGPHVVLPFSETFTPRPGDRITDDLGRTWEVQAAPNGSGTVMSGRIWHLRVKRWELT